MKILEVLGWVLLSLAPVFGLIGYAIYRATHDPVFPGRDRELLLVPYERGDELLRSGEGWRLAPEEDDNKKRGWVYLERYVERPPVNPHRWTDTQ